MKPHVSPTDRAIMAVYSRFAIAYMFIIQCRKAEIHVRRVFDSCRDSFDYSPT